MMSRLTSIVSLSLLIIGSKSETIYTGCVTTGLDTDYTLNPGDYIDSEDGYVSLRMQTDGNLCLYTKDGSESNPLIARFCTDVLGVGNYAIVSVLANLMVYDSSDTEIWSALNETTVDPLLVPIRLCVDDCGKAILYDIEGGALWESDYTVNPTLGNYPVDDCDNAVAPTMSPTMEPTVSPTVSYSGCVTTEGGNETFELMPGDGIYSDDGKVRLVMQLDTNLCLATKNSAGDGWIVRFCTNALSCCEEQTAIITADGNFIVVDENGEEKWKAIDEVSILPPYSATRLCVSDCGEAFLFDVSGDKLWTSTYNNNEGLEGYPNNCDAFTAPSMAPTMEPTVSPVTEVDPDGANRLNIVFGFWIMMLSVFWSL